jgi:hypothetical protein
LQVEPHICPLDAELLSFSNQSIILILIPKIHPTRLADYQFGVIAEIVEIKEEYFLQHYSLVPSHLSRAVLVFQGKNEWM